ncbi:addiction module toxin RelE [Cronobacter sakazakii]|nr:addiction module toxin RelE [Cronobacter sakazakii]EGT5692943.1 addiction module toxin RelE [Cronobacter sakazakii]EGT5700784.1 addiction module toxin RelE [Cronobacter sakazakii]EGT5717511.1 addiction module toxin RelE [Cronobacter sakazakii]EGT5724292.1 addiction module toxin RelE [Cronobacter sakazakii]
MIMPFSEYFALQEGGKLRNPRELTSVSNRGE